MALSLDRFKNPCEHTDFDKMLKMFDADQFGTGPFRRESGSKRDDCVEIYTQDFLEAFFLHLSHCFYSHSAVSYINNYFHHNFD